MEKPQDLLAQADAKSAEADRVDAEAYREEKDGRGTWVLTQMIMKSKELREQAIALQQTAYVLIQQQSSKQALHVLFHLLSDAPDRIATL